MTAPNAPAVLRVDVLFVGVLLVRYARAVLASVADAFSPHICFPVRPIQISKEGYFPVRCSMEFHVFAGEVKRPKNVARYR